MKPLALLALTLAMAPAASGFGIPPLDLLLIAWNEGCEYDAPYMTQIPAGVSGAGAYEDADGRRHVYVEGPTQDTNTKNHCVGDAQVTLIVPGETGAYRKDACLDCWAPGLP